MGARPPNDLDVILINTEQTSNRLQSSLQKDSPQRREPRRGRGWKWNKQDSGKRVWRYKFKLQKHPGRLYQTLGMFLQFCGKKKKKKDFQLRRHFQRNNANSQFGMESVTSAEKKLGTNVDLEKCNESEAFLVFLTADM